MIWPRICPEFCPNKPNILIYKMCDVSSNLTAPATLIRLNPLVVSVFTGLY